MKKRDKKQLLPGLLVAVAVSFLVFLYAPIDLYCSNVSEFWFDFSTLLITALGLAAASCSLPDRIGGRSGAVHLHLCPG